MDALLRRRLMMLGGGGPTPPAPWYVTDDLIAQFDGIWNAGRGVHSGNSADIVDLVSGDSLTLTGWTSVETDSLAVSARNTDTGVRFDGLSLSSNVQLTVEIVLSTTQYRTQNKGGFISVPPSGTFELYTWNLNSSPNFRTYKLSTAMNSSVRYYANGTPVTLSFVSTATGGGLYRNGSLIYSLTKAGNLSTSETYIRIGLGGYAGKLYAGRIYTRALTADEMIYNNNLDKTRFNF